MKALIVYYSQARGNTKRIAKMINKSLKADIVEIETVEPYTGSYSEIVDQGQQEVNSNYMPKIKAIDNKLEDYDTVIIGTPTWWYKMAPAVRTFIENNNFSGKTVIPFATNGGWPGHVIDDIKKYCKGAKFKCEKEIQFDSTGGDKLVTPIKEIENWIESITK